jgi:hypothetical protein
MTEAFSTSQQDILGKMGLCLMLCHEIEFFMSNSYLLGLTEKQKSKHKTINDLLDARNKMTIGALLNIIEEVYEIEPEFKKGFELFLWMRNKFIHGVTQEKKFNFFAAKGERELNKFIDTFFELCLSMRRIFRGCYLASLDFANEWAKRDGKKPPVKLTAEEIEQIGYFTEVFSIKVKISEA